MIFWYQEFKRIFDIKKSTLVSDFKNSISGYQEIIFWYHNFEFLISENDFLMSENDFLISGIIYRYQEFFLISKNQMLLSLKIIPDYLILKQNRIDCLCTLICFSTFKDTTNVMLPCICIILFILH